jgi:Flp pilus assembly protein TadG
MFMANNREKGTASVEFALILPLLLLMLFLIIEFSIILYDKAVITNASREGARSGIVYSEPPRVSVGAIIATVNTYCATNLISFGPDTPATAVPSGACGKSGDLLTVNVNYTYSFFVLPNLLGGGMNSGITLTGTTVMRCE